jgi:chloramphenicol-sensitive protein RarD
MGRLGVSSWEILAHRTVWAVPMALGFVVAARQGSEVRAALKTPRTVAWLALSAALIACNWSIYIWAVNSGRVLETSLGYYINPLLAMAAGALFFNERIDRLGMVAIALAALGVAVQAVAIGGLPLVSLALAFTFGGYGIVRKRVAASAQTGLLIECLLLMGPGMAYVLWLQAPAPGISARACRPRRGCWRAGRSQRCRWCYFPGPLVASRCRSWASCSSSDPPWSSPSE